MKTRIDLVAAARQAGIRRRRLKLRPIEARRATEREYARALKQLLRGAARIVRTEVVPAAMAVKSDLATDNERLDGVLGLLRSAVEFTLLGAAEAMVERILGLEYQRHTDRFAASVKSATSVDLKDVVSQADLSDEMALAVRRNVSLIKGLSNEVSKRVEQAVMTSVLRGGTAKALAKQLTHEFGVLESRAELIARDQTAKLTSDLNRLRQQQVGIDAYEFSTSADERVRHSHEAMEGKICRWDDPTVYREPGEDRWRSRSGIGGVELHPGEDIQCRCVPIAVLEF